MALIITTEDTGLQQPRRCERLRMITLQTPPRRSGKVAFSESAAPVLMNRS